MFAVNDTVQYGINGICTITDIRSCQFQDQPEEYYLLKPVRDAKSTIYVPVQNEALVSKMRKVLSKEEIYQLIQSMPKEEDVWIADDHERQKQFQEMIHSGDDLQLLRLIRMLHLRKQRQLSRGRKLRASEERLLEEAERVLYDEISIVMDMPQKQVVPFLLQQMGIEISA